MDIQFRTASQEDTEFAFRVEREAIQGYAIATWGEWREFESRDHAKASILAAQTQIIEVGKEPVGVLRLERAASSIELHQIYLLSAFQRRGIGAHILNLLKREARVSGLPIRLRVLKVNPAVRLYERLGFVATGQSKEHIYLTYAP